MTDSEDIRDSGPVTLVRNVGRFVLSRRATLRVVSVKRRAAGKVFRVTLRAAGKTYEAENADLASAIGDAIYTANETLRKEEP